MPTVVYTLGDSMTASYQGLGMIFGGNVNLVTVTDKLIGEGTVTSNSIYEGVTFNITLFVSVLLILVSSIILGLSNYVKVLNSKLFKLLGSAMLLGGAILIFFTTQSSGLSINAGDVETYNATLKIGSYSLGIGAIAAAVSGIVGSGLAISSIVFEK